MSTPKISVVVASGAGGGFLFRCLASLREQALRTRAEIIVVDRTGEATRQRVAGEFPRVRVVAAPSDHRATVPELRSIGVAHANGDILAVLEEHCAASPHWLDTIGANFRPDDAAIGGPILDSSFTRLRDWCVYFCEYHNYMPPWTDGPRTTLNGANIAYDAAKLAKYHDVLDAGYWEVVLHPRLAADGAFRAVNSMAVHHTGPFAYAYYLRQRFLLSRAWAGTQKTHVPLPKRMLHLLVGPIFPLFLFARVTARVLDKKQYLGRYLATLPLLVPAWFAYAWGEWLGYLNGPGRALEKVE
jgi:glycosyltransferase involved in cell wall biosynthesis